MDVFFPPPIETANELIFVRMGAGALAIGHRPPLRALARMRSAGVTHVATVLAAQENPHAIEAAARAAGLEWLWIELGSTKNLPKRADPVIARALDALIAHIAGGARIFLHCSAGIHRTGMITMALLFRLGGDAAEVAAALAALRPVTARDVGAARREWARSFAREARDG